MLGQSVETSLFYVEILNCASLGERRDHRLKVRKRKCEIESLEVVYHAFSNLCFIILCKVGFYNVDAKRKPKLLSMLKADLGWGYP